MVQRPLISILFVALLTIIANPVFANHFDDATLTADCDTYSIMITGGLFRPVTVDYVLNVTQGNGETFTEEGSIEVSNEPQHFAETISGS